MSDQQGMDQNNFTGIDNGMESGQGAVGVAGNLPVTILAQYIKDLSFENPNAPDTLRRSDQRPVMDANFAMDARKIEFEGRDNIYEVVLGLQTAAKKGDKIAFMCEIQYGILVDMSQVPADQHHPMLLIEMPRFAFPFVRQIVSNLTQQAGYMPLLLAPADFRAFYMQRFGGEMQGAERGAA
jgi:preprotein translocase subunit SecB